MNVKFTSYDKFVCTFHFSINPNTIKNVFKDFIEAVEDKYSFEDMVTSTDTPFFGYIEQTCLNDAIEDLGLITSTIKKVVYFNKYSVNRPIIGVVKALGIRVDYEFQTPKKIKCLNVTDEYIKNQFEDKMLVSGLFYKKATDKVKVNSIFNYDLKYLSNDSLVNVISNQEYDMQTDEEYDKTLFLGAKVGDSIVIDDTSITTTLEIKEIYNKTPYNDQLHDKKKIKSLGFENFSEFEEKYIDIAKRFDNTLRITDQYCVYFKSINEINVSDELKKVYEDNFGCCCSDNAFILDLLTKWYQYGNESSFPNLFIDSFYDCKIYYMQEHSERISFDEIMRYLNARVVEKCLVENGVKIEFID